MSFGAASSLTTSDGEELHEYEVGEQQGSGGAQQDAVGKVSPAEPASTITKRKKKEKKTTSFATPDQAKDDESEEEESSYDFEEEEHDIENPRAQHDSNDDIDSSDGSDGGSGQKHKPKFIPVSLSFRHVFFSVKIRKGKNPFKKRISKTLLKDVNGELHPGEVTAIMGPSGTLALRSQFSRRNHVNVWRGVFSVESFENVWHGVGGVHQRRRS